jgi:hypothetical protein
LVTAENQSQYRSQNERKNRKYDSTREQIQSAETENSGKKNRE